MYVTCGTDHQLLGHVKPCAKNVNKPKVYRDMKPWPNYAARPG